MNGGTREQKQPDDTVGVNWGRKLGMSMVKCTLEKARQFQSEGENVRRSTFQKVVQRSFPHIKSNAGLYA